MARQSIHRLLTFVALPALALAARGQNAQVLADINNTGQVIGSVGYTNGQVGDGMLTPSGLTLFSANTAATGLELWSTIGTPASTQLLADIAPGTNGSAPSNFFSAGSLTYFVADNGVTGKEVWTTDGTTAGTQLLKDINPGSAPSNPAQFMAFGGEVYFTARTDASGYEIWRTDGTGAGTSMLIEIGAGPISGASLSGVNNQAGTHFYFTGMGAATGAELWISDGTAAGTTLAADIRPGPQGSKPSLFVALNNQILFAAETPAFGYELWSFDELSGTAQLVKDIFPGQRPSVGGSARPVELGGFAYFVARAEEYNFELWRSDGTALGTTLVPEATPGLLSSSPYGLTRFANKLFYAASAPQTGTELYSVDAVTNIPQLIDANPTGSSKPGLLTISAGKLYFTAFANGFGREPWVTDGTLAGTHALGEVIPGPFDGNPKEFAPLAAGGVLFSAISPALGFQPYVADATGLALLKNIVNVTITGDSDPTNLTVVGGQDLYFCADNGTTGSEPYRWDPVNGAVLLKDVYPGSVSSLINGFTPAWINGQQLVFFSARSQGKGQELWVTDGTPAGTQLVKDINPSNDAYPRDMTAAFGQLYFTATTLGVRKLWKTNGTTAGTQAVADLATGVFNSVTTMDLVKLNDQLIFRGQTTSGDFELWSSDGTSAGTQLLKDIGGTFESEPSEMIRVGDLVAFVVKNPIATELWKTDGTALGTTLVSKIALSKDSGPGLPMVVMDGVLYFNGSTGFLNALWRSDLTPAGTTLVKEHGSFGVHDLIAANGQLYYYSAGGLNTSDGTPAGSFVVPSAPLPSGFSKPKSMVAAGQGIFFSPDYSTPVLDTELHFATPNFSAQFEDIAPGVFASGIGPQLPLSSEPSNLVLLDGDLIFVAKRSFGVGREIWRLPLTHSHVTDLGVSGSGQIISASQPVLGQPMVITGENAPVGQVSILAYSQPVSAPSIQLVTPGSASWLDIGTALPTSVETTSSWTRTIALPATPALAGFTFNMQSWTLGSPTQFPASTSNGLQITLGS